jgi:dienelactone hydrolase
VYLAPEPWPEYPRASFASDGLTFDVLRHVVRGAATVILLHELPGHSEKTIAVADRIVAGGFSVAMPILLPARDPNPGLRQALRNTRRVCVSEPFAALARRRDRPVTAWIRSLAAHEAAVSGRPVGIVGMSVTGSLALAAAVDTTVGAAVASQPSLPPTWLGWTDDLAMSNETLDDLVDRAEAGFRVRALRFSRDPVSRRRRIRFIAEQLPNAQIVEVPAISPTRHSVLVSALRAREGTALHAALAGTISYLQDQLGLPPDDGIA